MNLTDNLCSWETTGSSLYAVEAGGVGRLPFFGMQP